MTAPTLPVVKSGQRRMGLNATFHNFPERISRRSRVSSLNDYTEFKVGLNTIRER